MKRVATDLEIIGEIMDVRGATVLDVGCGNGRLAQSLAGQGASVIGVESPTLLFALAQTPPSRACSFAVCPGEALCIRGGSIDLVLYMASFHHVPPPLMRAALAEARVVLRETGRLIVVEPVAEPGSYFELVRLAEDERDLQRAAAQALHSAADIGLCLLGEQLVYFERSYDDYVGLVDAYVEAAEDRRRILTAAHGLASLLAAAESHTLGSHRFRSICRVSCLAVAGAEH